MRNSLVKYRGQLTRVEKRRVGANTQHNCDIVIADLSSSMSCSAFDGKTRHECLQEAMTPFKGRVQVLAFNSSVWEVDADALPHPSGSTNLSEALEVARSLEPVHVLVISDGAPNSRDAALKAAEKLAEICTIDAMYIGPEGDTGCIEFMRTLAEEIGRGRFIDFRVDKESPLLLEQKIDSLLALPAPGSIQL